jgi:RNA polymerase sigma factor (sigma-70 family)
MNATGIPQEKRNDLAISMAPLVHKIVGKYLKRAPMADPDSVLSAANFGLLDAMNKYDASKGFAFATLAQHRILGQILDDARKEMKNRGKSRYKDYVTVQRINGPSNGKHIDWTHPHAKDALAKVLDREEMRQLLSGIPDRRARFILKLYFIENLTMREAGKAAGLSESRGSQFLTNYTPILRERYEKMVKARAA